MHSVCSLEPEGVTMTMLEVADRHVGLGRRLNLEARTTLASAVPPSRLERPLLKAAIILTWVWGSIAVLVVGVGPMPMVLLATVVLGLAIATNLMTVAHEVLHHRMLPRAWMDEVLQVLAAGPMAIEPTWWRAKHNVTHHGGPARGGRVGEGPVEVGPVARLGPEQRWHPWHRLQVVYVPLLLFPLHGLGMIAGGVFYCATGRVSGHQVGATTPGAIVRRTSWFLLIPGLVLAVATWRHGLLAALLVALLAVAVSGTAGSLALAVEVAERGRATVPPGPGLDPWTQWHIDVSMTIDAPGWVAWFTGGLHQHTAHHLFPRAPMHRLADLSPIVEVACQEHGVTYHRYTSYPASWQAFLAFLVEMGRRPQG
jgi:linoleoyl-CoA desaturase